MLSARWMMFAAFAFIVGTLLSLMMESMTLGGDQTSLMTTLTGYNVVEVSAAGNLALPKLAAAFFSHGLPTILLWDYRFLDGSWQIVKYILLWPLSVGIIYGVTIAFASAVQGVFARFL